MTTAQEITAPEIISLLELAPHPEGGWFKETFRDEPGPDGRARSTAIFFLLQAGEESAWHRIDAVEAPRPSGPSVSRKVWRYQPPSGCGSSPSRAMIRAGVIP